MDYDSSALAPMGSYPFGVETSEMSSLHIIANAFDRSQRRSKADKSNNGHGRSSKPSKSETDKLITDTSSSSHESENEPSSEDDVVDEFSDGILYRVRCTEHNRLEKNFYSVNNSKASS